MCLRFHDIHDPDVAEVLLPQEIEGTALGLEVARHPNHFTAVNRERLHIQASTAIRR